MKKNENEIMKIIFDLCKTYVTVSVISMSTLLFFYVMNQSTTKNIVKIFIEIYNFMIHVYIGGSTFKPISTTY